MCFCICICVNSTALAKRVGKREQAETPGQPPSTLTQLLQPLRDALLNDGNPSVNMATTAPTTAGKQAPPTTLPQERSDALTAVFKLFDVNGDGELEIDEFRLLGWALNNRKRVPTGEQALAELKRADADASNTVSCEEFLAFSTSMGIGAMPDDEFVALVGQLEAAHQELVCRGADALLQSCGGGGSARLLPATVASDQQQQQTATAEPAAQQQPQQQPQTATLPEQKQQHGRISGALHKLFGGGK